MANAEEMYGVPLGDCGHHLYSHFLFFGPGDKHYGWGSQLLLLHHATFMKHLTNGLQVNISFTDKTEPYTLNKTWKRSASTTTCCERITRAVSSSPYPIPQVLMGLINEAPFQNMLNTLWVYSTLYVWFKDCHQ